MMIIFQGFDPHSAFFTKVVNKKKKGGSLSEHQTTKPKNDKGGKSDEEVEQKFLPPSLSPFSKTGVSPAHLGYLADIVILF